MVNFASEGPLSFQTQRLNIRRYTLDDDQRLYSAARESIPEVGKFLPWCHHDYSIDDSRSWLQTIIPGWHDKQSYAFAITDKDTGEFIGGCVLNAIDENPIANLGYWIRSSEANKGYATEATRGLLIFGFLQLKYIRIEILVSTKNLASQKVAINANATLEGTLRNRLLLHGENHDALLYSVVPDDIIMS